MNDRWLRAEERLRQSTEERRYRRSDQDWGEADTPATGNSEIPVARGDMRAPSSGELPAARSGEMRAARSRGMRRVAPGEEPRSRRGDRGGNEPRAARGARHAAPSDDDWDDFDDTSVIPRYSDEYEAGYPEHSTGAHARVEPDYGRHGYPEPAYGDPYADQGYVDQGPAGYPAPGQDAQGYGGYDNGQGYYPEADYADEELPAAEPPARRGRRRRPDEDLDDTPQAVRAQAPAKRAARKQTARKQAPATGAQQAARRGRSDERPPRGRSRGRGSRVASRKAAERKRRRRNFMYIGTVFVVLFAVAAIYAGYKLMGRLGGPDDYTGPAGPLAVVQVHPGDTADQIAKSMLDKGVVKSTGAFYQAAVRNSGMNSLQPGYYAIPTHSKGEDAVTALMSKDSRVGNVVISEGRRLHDSTDVNTGSRNDGIYRKIAAASCVGAGSAKKCVTYEQLDQAGAGADLNALGVPKWALDSVRQVPDHTRQLEGLIAAGTWDFDPSGTPTQILAQLVSQSAHGYESTGLLTPNPAAGISLSPYQTLIASSLVEREALAKDMPRVARVIVNRLNTNMPLEFDSTVNYTLASTEVATTQADRDRKTPWNTYAMAGLPATPIASPSLDAMRAMENPTAGPWLYFVTVDKQGLTLFTDSYSEHQRNIEKARQSGILDSGR